MKRFTFAVCFLFLCLAGGTVLAAKPAQDIAITQEISDYDNNYIAYSIQSDGLGFYINSLTTSRGKTTGTTSVLMANTCNGQDHGDRLLDTTATGERQVKVTLDSTNAIMPGDPNYLVPAQLQGLIVSPVRNMNTCTCGANLNMYKLAAGATIFCPMHLKLEPINYRLEMGNGDSETENVQIVCNSADLNGCKDWFIDPISNPDYTSNPGKTRARLVNLTNGQNMGNFYITFHFHVTRP